MLSHAARCAQNAERVSADLLALQRIDETCVELQKQVRSCAHARSRMRK